MPVVHTQLGGLDYSKTDFAGCLGSAADCPRRLTPREPGPKLESQECLTRLMKPFC